MRIRTGTIKPILTGLLLAGWLVALVVPAWACVACCCCGDEPAPVQGPVFSGCGCDMAPSAPSQAAAEQIMNPFAQVSLAASQAAPEVRLVVPAESFAAARALPQNSPSPPRASSTILQI